MFLSREILQNYPIKDSLFNKFNELYPSGAETTEIIQDGRAPSNFLHWIVTFLPINSEDEELYKKRLKINNCNNFLYSKDITNCDSIFNSKNCKNSNLVKNSSFIEDSNFIINSKKIYSSNKVFNSKEVRDSNSIIEGNYIKDSYNIFNSENIYTSNSVFKSKEVFDSIGVASCKNIKNVIFSTNCEKCMDIMFSFGLIGEENCIFNKTVPQKTFKEIKENFINLFPSINLKLFSLNETLPTANQKGYQIYQNYQDHYKFLPKEFYDFLKTLPNYDPIILYTLTLNPTFLYD